ncbi:transposase [Bacteroides sp.]
MRVLKEFCSGIKVILADGGYRGELIENVKNKFGYVIQVVISAYKEQGFKPIHKRWIVERTFSWMENDRRLCRNYELTFDSAEEMVKISAIKLLLKKI